MRKLLAACALLALAGCATASQQSSIAALEVGLATAESAATTYASLPRCPAAGICSDPAVVAQIKDADNVAYRTLKDAEKVAASGATVDLTASMAAITALQNIIPIIQTAR